MKIRYAVGVFSMCLGVLGAGMSPADAAEPPVIARNIQGGPTVERGGTAAPLQEGDRFKLNDVVQTDGGAGWTWFIPTVSAIA